MSTLSPGLDQAGHAVDLVDRHRDGDVALGHGLGRHAGDGVRGLEHPRHDDLARGQVGSRLLVADGREVGDRRGGPELGRDLLLHDVSAVGDFRTGERAGDRLGDHVRGHELGVVVGVLLGVVEKDVAQHRGQHPDRDSDGDHDRPLGSHPSPPLGEPEPIPCSNYEPGALYRHPALSTAVDRSTPSVRDPDRLDNDLGGK